MNRVRFQFLNWFLLLVVMLLACGVQTTIWYQLVGGIPAPALWLNVILYIILYRQRLEAILINYCLALVVAPFTSASLASLWINLLVISLVVSFAKKRLFWPGTRYFIISSFGISILFQITSGLFSYFMDRNVVAWGLYTRTIEVLFTPICAAPVFWLLSFVDRLSEKTPVPERGVEA